jgi:AbrB family looped-hinge helix DNA binding protein
MSELIQVRRKSQVTLPASVRKKLGIEEGDYMDVQVRGGEVVMRPKKLIDKDQAYFWTERWQQGEREVEADKAAGRVYHFDNVEEAIVFLDTKPSDRKTTKSGD